MTVPVPGSLTYSYDEDGSTTVFAYPVRFLEPQELTVIREVAGVQTVLAYNVDYTVSGAGNPSGGSITRTAVTNGGKIIIARSTAWKQIIDLEDAQRNPAEAVELQLDRLAMAGQDARRDIDRSVMVDYGAQPLKPLPSPEPGKVLAGNADGTGYVNAPMSEAEIAADVEAARQSRIGSEQARDASIDAADVSQTQALIAIGEAARSEVAAQDALVNANRAQEAAQAALDAAFNPGDHVDVFWDLSDKSTLYQDESGTIPVTADGDPLRQVFDKSGNGNHLIILTTGSPAIYREVGGRKYIEIDGSAGVALRTANNKVLSPPLYICAAFTPQTAIAAPYFGVISAANRRVSIQGHTVQNRIIGWAQDSSGIADPYSAYNAGPLDAPMVADALLVDGQYDLRINGTFADPNSNPHPTAFAGDGITNAVYGVNMLNTTTASASRQHFYGGAILHGDPGPEIRASIVNYFRRKVERPATPADNVPVIIGDSTGNGWPGSTDAKEWPYYLAVNKIAADDPSAFVGMRLYSEEFGTYGPEVVFQQGTGGPSWRIYNCSVPGRTPQFHTGAQFKAMLQDIPRPTRAIVNHGHNIRETTPVAASYIGRYMGLIEQFRLQWPGVPMAMIYQNAWRTSNNMATLIPEQKALVALYGDIAVADVYQEYIDAGKPAAWYAGGTDNIHPSEQGVLEGWMPVIDAMWDNWILSPAIPAFVASKAASPLINGKLDQWSNGRPTGWTLVGDGSVSRDAAIRDGSDTYSVKIVNGAGTATLLRQTIDATPAQGMTVTLAVRQYVHAGSSEQTAGQIRLSSDGAGAPSVANYAGLTNQGAGGWRWMVVSLAVPADATTITVDLHASNVAGADKGIANYGRAILIAGVEPRDAV